MTKNLTETIYHCLGSAFWTKRKCKKCQEQFIKEDYQKHNYYLTFWEIGQVSEAKESTACLEGVIVRLFHQHCQAVKHYPNEYQFEIMKDITC